MNKTDLDLMIKELDEFLDDFLNDRKMIDPQIGKTAFKKKSSYGLADEHFTLSDKLSGHLSQYREYRNSNDRWRSHYISECYRWLMKARTMGAIKVSDKMKSDSKELKKQFEELESKYKEAQFTIEELRDIRSKLEERIRIHESMYHDLKRLGKTEESEVFESE